jgi:hypothetical protein
MIIREQAEAVYAWDLQGTKHQVSVDFHDLVRAELGRWAGEANEAREAAAELQQTFAKAMRSGK